MRAQLPCEVLSIASLVTFDVSDNDFDGGACPVTQESALQVYRLGDNAFNGHVPWIAGSKLTAVTLGGSNRWRCELPEPSKVIGWIDPPPSTICIVRSSVGALATSQRTLSVAVTWLFGGILVLLICTPLAIAAVTAFGVSLPSLRNFLAPAFFLRWIRYEDEHLDGD